jgi:hypothetical protein
MGRTAVRCSCGQRIRQREVLHAGYYPRPFGPSYVLVRYRCSRCRKRGEQFLKQEEWNSGIFEDPTTESTTPEKSLFDTLGPIQPTEQAAFHQELESLSSLSELIAEFNERDDRPES